MPSDQNQDEVWSQFVDTGSFTIEDGRGPELGFDGNLTTSCAVNAQNSIYYIYLKDPSFANKEVEVYSSNPNETGLRYLTLNGDRSDVMSERWYSLGNAAADGTATIGVGSTSVSIRTTFRAVRIDGKILVDPTGQTQVTGPLCQGTGDYVSHTGNTLELTNAGGRWCVDNQNVGLMPSATPSTQTSDLALPMSNSPVPTATH